MVLAQEKKMRRRLASRCNIGIPKDSVLRYETALKTPCGAPLFLFCPAVY
jgi:hypothetical protein